MSTIMALAATATMISDANISDSLWKEFNCSGWRVRSRKEQAKSLFLFNQKQPHRIEGYND